MNLPLKSKNDLNQNRYGFTLLEIIMVLVIIGILSAYVAKTSLNMIDTADEQSQISQAKVHLKYAQGRAINSNSVWGIQFNASQYVLFEYDVAITYHYFPGLEKPLANSLANCQLPMPESVTESAFVWFDHWGRAYKGLTLNPGSASPISANTTLLSGKLIIEQHTGFIHDT